MRIQDDDIYSDACLRFDVNQHLLIRVIYGDNINCLKHNVDYRQKQKHYKTSLGMQTDNPTFTSETGLNNLLLQIDAKSTNSLLQHKLAYAPVIYKGTTTAAAFTFIITATKTIKLNQIKNILQEEVMLNLKILILLAENRRVEVLQQKSCRVALRM